MNVKELHAKELYIQQLHTSLNEQNSDIIDKAKNKNNEIENLKLKLVEEE